MPEVIEGVDLPDPDSEAIPPFGICAPSLASSRTAGLPAVSLSEAMLGVILTGAPCSSASGFRVVVRPEALSAVPPAREVLPFVTAPSASLLAACPFPLAANCTVSASALSATFPFTATAVAEVSSFPLLVLVPALGSAVIVSSPAICPAHIVI
ncbi:hypothetical protein D3C76_694860 [compost metagenome]